MPLPGFNDLRKEMELLDTKREYTIDKSRKVVKLSKKVIYSVHRNDLKSAEKYSKEIKKSMADLKNVSKKNPGSNGSLKVASQEFVEAMCFFEYVKSKKIPSKTSLNVTAEEYLLGLCDLTGELVRLAINKSLKEDFKTPIEIKDFVENIYSELMLFDFRGGELRKKFDSIKYDLRKLEDLALNIKLKK